MAKKVKLSESKRKLLGEALKENPNIKIFGCSKGENKGWSDLPMFADAIKDKHQQTNFFENTNEIPSIDN